MASQECFVWESVIFVMGNCAVFVLPIIRFLYGKLSIVCIESCVGFVCILCLLCIYFACLVILFVDLSTTGLAEFLYLHSYIIYSTVTGSWGKNLNLNLLCWLCMAQIQGSRRGSASLDTAAGTSNYIHILGNLRTRARPARSRSRSRNI